MHRSEPRESSAVTDPPPGELARGIHSPPSSAASPAISAVSAPSPAASPATAVEVWTGVEVPARERAPRRRTLDAAPRRRARAGWNRLRAAGRGPQCPLPERVAFGEDVCRHVRVALGLLEVSPARAGHLTVRARHHAPYGQPTADRFDLPGVLQLGTYGVDAPGAAAEGDHSVLDRMQGLLRVHRTHMQGVHDEQPAPVQCDDRAIHHPPGAARQERDVLHIQRPRLARASRDPPERPPHTRPPPFGALTLGKLTY